MYLAQLIDASLESLLALPVLLLLLRQLLAHDGQGADPLSNIETLRNIDFVMKDGKVIRRER
jgi:hypothetical protein